MRIYELSKKLNISNREMINSLKEMGYEYSTHMQHIDENVARLFTENTQRNLSPIKFFEINKLFGKHSYRFNFDDVVNILISENGCGKTTILNLFVSFLKGDIQKLRSIPFSSIKMGFADQTFEIEKSEISPRVSPKDHISFVQELRYYIPRADYEKLRFKNTLNTDSYITHIMEKYRYDLPLHLNDYFEKTYLTGGKREKELRDKLLSVQKRVQGDVLYFPTFRRIEEDLEKLGLSTEGDNPLKRKYQSNSINFGMADVEEKISEITNKLKADAIQEYSRMNGEILDDLLSNNTEALAHSKHQVKKEIIEIIIGRIGKDKIKHTDELFKFIINEYSVDNDNFLRYYLLKLNEIYEKQRDVDNRIKSFVSTCNNYLVNKEILYNEVTAEVKVFDRFFDQEIKFGQLSSGEKQILSIFSKLHLDTCENTIIVIDEPELSLSLKWQKLLLPDIVRSGKCGLLVTTTHSPFIFSNEYSTCAKELEMFRI